MNNVWAIARNTIAQAIRMKVALIVILLLGILLPILSVIVVGDGTLIGKLQTFSSYGISLMSLMLCFLTIAVSCFTLNSDMKDKQIFTVLTKPVMRFQVLLGKFLGVLVLNTSLLVLFSIVIYVLIVTLPRFADAPREQYEQANNEFFTSRIGLKPIVDIEKAQAQAEAELEDMIKKNDPLLDTMTRNELLRMLRGQKILQAKSVEPGASIKWEFNNVRPATQDEKIFLRFRLNVSETYPDITIYSRWVAGDLRALEKGERPETPLFDSRIRNDIAKAAREIEIPASVVGKDGYLNVGFQNLYYNGMTVFPRDIEVFYKSDPFWVNYIRAVGMIFIRLVFFAALGITLSTWLSFPVSIFVCLVFYVTATTNGFITESFGLLSQGVGVFYGLVVKPILSIFPKFDGEYNPAPMIVAGRSITWVFLLKAWLFTVMIKSLLIFLFGVLVFSRREIARVTV